MERNENRRPLIEQRVPRLSAALGSFLAQGLTPADYPRHSTILSQNAPGDLFYLRSGLVKVCLPNRDGSRFVVGLAGPGDVLGYVTVDDSDGNWVQEFEAESLTDCSAVPIARARFTALLAQMDSATVVQIAEQINGAWSRKFADFVRFLNLTFRERLEARIIDLAARFGRPHPRGILLPPEISHHDLSELIGSSRPMAARLLDDMLKDGVLARDGADYVFLIQN